MEIMRQPTYVLAIDPALSTTGYAIIDRDTCELVHVDKITTSPKDSNDDRILSLLTELTQVAEKYWISNVVLEDGFSGPNQKTALQLATLRGAIIGLFRFRQYSVSHMQPTQIRKALGCGGNAKKEQIAEEVIKIYGTQHPVLQLIGPYSDKQNKQKTSDIYDAISIGVAFIKTIRKDDGL